MAEFKIAYKYNGTIEQFKASDYPTTYADKTVYIMGDAEGTGKGVFVAGDYMEFPVGDTYLKQGENVLDTMLIIHATGGMTLKARTGDMNLSAKGDINIFSEDGGAVNINGTDFASIPVYYLGINPTVATTPTSGFTYAVTACSGVGSTEFNKLMACATSGIPIYVYLTTQTYRRSLCSVNKLDDTRVQIDYTDSGLTRYQIVFNASGFVSGSAYKVWSYISENSGSSGSASKEVVELGSSDTSITAEPGKVYRWNNEFLPDDGTELEISFDLPTDTTQHAEYFFEIPVMNSGEGTAVTIVSPDSLRIADNTCKAGYVTFIRVVYVSIMSVDRWYVADKTEVFEPSLWQ